MILVLKEYEESLEVAQVAGGMGTQLTLTLSSYIPVYIYFDNSTVRVPIVFCSKHCLIHILYVSNI